MAKIFTSTIGQFSRGDELDALDGKQLLTLHNELTGKATKKFASLNKGREQTKRALESWKKQQPGPKDILDPSEQPSFRPDTVRGQLITMASVADGALASELLTTLKLEPAELNDLLSRIEKHNKLTVKRTGEGAEERIIISGQLRTRKAFAFDPKRELREYRPDTKRAKTVEMLLKGATFEDIKSTNEWDDRTAYEGIRLIHVYLGYGLKETPDGRIFAFTR